MKTPDNPFTSENNNNIETTKIVVDAIRLILQGKIQSAFLRKKEPKLMIEFKSALEELDECSTLEQLKITARANGTEITQEELNFAIEMANKKITN